MGFQGSAAPPVVFAGSRRAEVQQGLGSDHLAGTFCGCAASGDSGLARLCGTVCQVTLRRRRAGAGHRSSSPVRKAGEGGAGASGRVFVSVCMCVCVPRPPE